MSNILYEIKIEIFKYVDKPLDLILSNSMWKVISQDPHARAEWVITKYGKARAIYHALRLGNNFLTLDVIKCIISKKAIFSRYLMQRLLLQYWQYDRRLIELKVLYNNKILQVINEHKLKVCQEKLRYYWASDLSLPVFNYLIDHSFKLYGISLMLKGNDMELFNLLSTRFSNNKFKLKNLIFNKKFIPLLPSSKFMYYSRYSGKYGYGHDYEGINQLQIIGRTIAMHPELVNWWKQLGYHEICHELNNFVMVGIFSILFPPTLSRPSDCPNEFEVCRRVRLLTDLGFVLHNHTVRDIVFILSIKLPIISDVLFKAFELIRNAE
ncbi:hypothetical protein C1645_806646 [Glomus cerebriforme]|uniref:Uncharacterized protein n=1 Tax=Glomus cerebriforme TaxID=658196 RepID=A0A397SY14_9GLOM|nr:hypothetical protein C1645_806646 [Glomus cerebriforme]